MKRRQFVLAGLAASGLFGAGIGLSAISPRAARAQTRNLRPLATGAAQTARGLMTVRAYRGQAEGQYLVMSRLGGRDTWRVCDLAEMLGVTLNRAVNAGQLSGAFELPGNRLGNFEIQDLRAPTRKSFTLTLNGATLRGEGTTEVPEGEPPSTTSAIGFWGAMVAIAAIFGIVALAGIISGNPIEFKMRVRGLEISVNVGGEADPPSAPVVHNPICDTMPPMNC